MDGTVLRSSWTSDSGFLGRGRITISGPLMSVRLPCCPDAMCKASDPHAEGSRSVIDQSGNLGKGQVRLAAEPHHLTGQSIRVLQTGPDQRQLTQLEVTQAPLVGEASICAHECIHIRRQPPVTHQPVRLCPLASQELDEAMPTHRHDVAQRCLQLPQSRKDSGHYVSSQVPGVFTSQQRFPRNAPHEVGQGLGMDGLRRRKRSTGDTDRKQHGGEGLDGAHPPDPYSHRT